MLAVGEKAPLEARVWLGPNEQVSFADIVADAPVLLLFYLFDWTGT